MYTNVVRNIYYFYDSEIEYVDLERKQKLIKLWTVMVFFLKLFTILLNETQINFINEIL